MEGAMMAENITITTDNKGAFPDGTMWAASDIIPNALIYTQATQGPQIIGDSPQARIAYIPDDAEVGFVKEGATIDEGDVKLSELKVFTRKLAVLNVLSNEAAESAAQNVKNGMELSLMHKADYVFLQNNPAGDDLAQPTGLANVAGIVDGGQITSATGLVPMVSALGTVADNGAETSGIIMNHGTWARLLSLTDKNGRGLIAPDVANSAAPTLYGIPVVLNTQAPADTVLLVDKTQVLSASSQVSVASSQDYAFGRDGIALRLTMRVGFGVIRPNRLAKLTVSTSE